MVNGISLLDLRESHVLTLADFASHLSKIEFWNLKPELNNSKVKATSPSLCPILNDYKRAGTVPKIYKELCSLPHSTPNDCYTIMVAGHEDDDPWGGIRFHHVDANHILVEMDY